MKSAPAYRRPRSFCVWVFVAMASLTDTAAFGAGGKTPVQVGEIVVLCLRLLPGRVEPGPAQFGHHQLRIGDWIFEDQGSGHETVDVLTKLSMPTG